MADVVRKLREELGVTRPPQSFHVEVHVWAQPGDTEDKVAGEVASGLRRCGRDAIVRSVSADPQDAMKGRRVRIITERSS